MLSRISNCLKRIEEYLCKETVSLQILKEVFFGDPGDQVTKLSGGMMDIQVPSQLCLKLLLLQM